TPFAGGPGSLTGFSATSAVTLASLPPGSRAIYRTGSAVAVASIPVGCGTVTLMGWDWFSAQPEGAQDSGWLDVLNRALGQDKRMLVDNDFNGDTHADVFWRNTSTGATVIWLMEGNTVRDSGPLGAVANPPWELAGTGDFNRDCKADIMWRNTSTGANFLWQMDGLSLEASGSIGGVATTWEIVGIHDYDGDRASDLLWRNTATGGNIIWFMDGFGHTTGPLGPVTPAWVVEE
ncbi:MAG: VCBS repeat-containing protein, partial [Rhodospirillales bacterium]|nr:VCBS repeat-containing protein [Rhodospirillales bacterium]